MSLDVVEVTYDAGAVAGFADPDGRVPSVASASLRRQDGTLLQSLPVTLPAASTTTATGTTADILVLASATGFHVGDEIGITSDGVVYTATIARLDGANAHLLARLPLVPDSGSAVTVLTMLCTIAAPGEQMIGRGLSLTWLYTIDLGVREQRQAVEVVRVPWTPAATPGLVRDIISNSYLSTDQTTWGYCQQVADRANREIRQYLYATGRRPALYFSAGAFQIAADKAVRYTLAEDGYGGGLNPEIRKSAWASMDWAMKTTMKSIRPYSPTDDGGAEAKPQYGTIQCER